MKWRVFLHAVVAVLAAMAQVQAGVMYTVTDLGAMDARAINDRGQVVGLALPSGASIARAFRTSPNRPLNPATDDLGTLGGDASEALGINNLGQVIGHSEVVPGDDDLARAFRTAPNQPINPLTDELGTLGGSETHPGGINDRGEVVGSSLVRGSEYHAFRTGPNQPVNPATDDLGTLGGAGSGASGINAIGQVTGSDSRADGRVHAFRTAPNSAINPLTDDLGTLGGPWSHGGAINANGQVAGISAVSDDPADRPHIFRTSAKAPITPMTDDLGTFGVRDLKVLGMNDRGDIIGIAAMDMAERTYRGFVVMGSSLFDVNDLIDPASGWTLEIASGINNLGQIVGIGKHNGEFGGFRLDPVPEPSAIFVGIGGLCVYISSRRSHRNNI